MRLLSIGQRQRCHCRCFCCCCCCSDWTHCPFDVLQVNFVQLDVTEDCKAIVNAVNDLCGSAGRWANNFTVTHFVDIFKGSEVKKVVEAGKKKTKKNGSLSTRLIDCFVVVVVVVVFF